MGNIFPGSYRIYKKMFMKYMCKKKLVLLRCCSDVFLKYAEFIFCFRYHFWSQIKTCIKSKIEKKKYSAGICKNALQTKTFQKQDQNLANTIGWF